MRAGVPGRTFALEFPTEGEMASRDREEAGRKVDFEISPIVTGKTPEGLLQASVDNLAQMIVLMKKYFVLTCFLHEHPRP